MVVAAGAVAFSFDRVVDERDRARAAQREAANWANDVLLGRARAELETDALRALRTLAELSPEAGHPHWSRARVIALAAQLAGLPKVLYAGADLHDMRFAGDGDRIVGLDNEHAIFAVPVAGGETEILESHGERLSHLAVSQDGTYLAVASADTTIRVRPIDGGPPRVLRGHEGMIARLAFFPAGRRLVSASMDRTVRVWDLATLEDRILGGDEAIATSLAVSRDGRRVAAALGRGGVRVWDAGSGEVLADHTFEGIGTTVAFSPDGARVVAGSEHGLYALDLAGNELEEISGVEGGIYSVDISATGMLAAGGEGRAVRLWDAELETKGVLRGYADEVALVRFSDRGEILASLSFDGAIRVWRMQDEPALLMSIPGGRDAAGLLLSRDGQRMAALRGGALRVWSVGGATQVIPLEDGIDPRGVSFDRTGTEIAVHGGKGIAFYDATGSAEVYDQSGAADVVALGPERGVVVLDHGGRVRVIRRAGEDLELAGRAHARVAVSANGRVAAAPALDSSALRLWDLETGEARMLETERRASAAVFSADGRWLAAAIGSAVWVWDMSSGDRVELGDGEETVRQLVIGERGRCVVAASDDGIVRVWDVAARERRVIADARWLSDLESFGACERVAWIASDGAAELWTPSGDAVPLRSARALKGVEFSPDGTLLAGFDGRSGLLLWNAQTGSAMRIADSELRIRDLAFSPDGSGLATLEPGGVRRWSLRVPRGEDAIRRWLLDHVDAAPPAAN
jgi:WD40 repeat protein